MIQLNRVILSVVVISFSNYIVGMDNTKAKSILLVTDADKQARRNYTQSLKLSGDISPKSVTSFDAPKTRINYEKIPDEAFLYKKSYVKSDCVKAHGNSINDSILMYCYGPLIFKLRDRPVDYEREDKK
jgi:hypothetical protein